MRKITEKQRGFLLRLAEEREFPSEADKDRLYKALRISEDPEEFGMSLSDASRSIEWLLNQPRVAVEEEEEGDLVTEPGVFEVGSDVYVVKPNRKGTRLYAKKLVEAPGARLTEAGEVVDFELEYAPGAMRFIREEQRMPLARAKELTVRYGRCINCGRHLKAAESVERGIGPVCAKRFAGYREEVAA